MENEQNLELEQEQIEEPDEPKKLTPEQERGIKQRQFTKLAKELGVELPHKEELQKEPPKPAKKAEFDYGELSYLEGVKGVTHEDDQKLILDEINLTGRTLKQVLEFRHVQDELKSRAEDRKTLAALPESSQRAGGLGKNTVEYWLARGGLPEGAENQKLREDIVNAKIARAQSSLPHPF